MTVGSLLMAPASHAVRSWRVTPDLPRQLRTAPLIIHLRLTRATTQGYPGTMIHVGAGRSETCHYGMCGYSGRRLMLRHKQRGYLRAQYHACNVLRGVLDTSTSLGIYSYAASQGRSFGVAQGRLPASLGITVGGSQTPSTGSTPLYAGTLYSAASAFTGRDPTEQWILTKPGALHGAVSARSGGARIKPVSPFPHRLSPGSPRPRQNRERRALAQLAQSPALLRESHPTR